MLYHVQAQDFGNVSGYLWQMHRQRHKVVAELYRRPALQNWMRADVDPLDDQDASYLMMIDGGKLLASARIRTSNTATLASTLYSGHYGDQVPDCDDVLEVSRAVVFDPAWTAADGASVMDYLHAGLLEIGLHMQASALSLQLDLMHLPVLGRMGLAPAPITRAFACDATPSGAAMGVLLPISGEALSTLRTARGMANTALNVGVGSLQPFRTPYAHYACGEGFDEIANAIRDPLAAPSVQRHVDQVFRGYAADRAINFDALLEALDSYMAGAA